MNTYASFGFSNFPTIITPAYNIQNYLIGYFVILYIVFFVCSAVLLAILVSTYKNMRGKTAIKERMLERRSLATAFLIMDSKNESLLSFRQVSSLVKVFCPNESVEDLKDLWCDIDKVNNKIDMKGFFYFFDVLLLRFKKTKNLNKIDFSKDFPDWRKKLLLFVQSKK